jgi:hypothetical protein
MSHSAASGDAAVPKGKKDTPWDLQWLRQIARDPEARALPMAVAAIMSEYMDGRTHETYVSQTKLAGVLGVSIDGLRKAQKRLVENGHLELVSAGSGGRPNGDTSSARANIYRAIVRTDNPQMIVGGLNEKSPAKRRGNTADKYPDDRPEIPRQPSDIPQMKVGTIPLSGPLELSPSSGWEPAAQRSPNKIAWDQAKALLVDRGRLTDAAAGKFFGKLLSDHAIAEASQLLPAIEAANASGTADPRAYLTKAARSAAEQKRTHHAGARNGREAQFIDRHADIAAAMRVAAKR